MKIIKKIWKKWLPISQVVGNFMGQLIMTVFYLIILLPLGVVIRLFNDALKVRNSKLLTQKTNFEKWDHPKQSLEESKKQY